MMLPLINSLPWGDVRYKGATDAKQGVHTFDMTDGVGSQFRAGVGGVRERAKGGSGAFYNQWLSNMSPGNAIF